MAKNFRMAGTEGTNEYVGLAVTDRGALAFRRLHGECARIRVEPVPNFGNEVATVLTREHGWKQLGDDNQNRLSTVAYSPEQEDRVVAMAFVGLGVESVKHLTPAVSKAMLASIADTLGIALAPKATKSEILEAICK